MMRRRNQTIVLAAAGVAVALLLAGAAAILVGPGSDTDAALDRAVAVLLRDVVKPETLGAGDQVVAFKFDAPLAAGARISAYLPDPLPDDAQPAECATDVRVLERPTWFFWVDDAPSAMFSHPSRFVLIDPKTDAVLAVSTHGWPPCVDGNPVTQWLDDSERAKPEHRAFSTSSAAASAAPRPDGIPPSPGVWRAFAPDATVLALGRDGATVSGVALAEPEQVAVVAIDGGAASIRRGRWAFDADTQRAREFARQRGLPEAGGTVDGSDPVRAIRSQIDTVVAGGRANSVFLMITAHGGVTTSGESFILVGGVRMFRSQLDRLIGSYEGVTFNLAVSSCRSSDFRNLQSKNVARVETCASSVHDLCMFDTGLGNQPGSRWTKALLTALERDEAFSGCPSCSLEAAGRAGAALADATVFKPLFKDPVTGKYVLTGSPPPGGLPSTTAPSAVAPPTAATSAAPAAPSGNPAAPQAPAVAPQPTTAIPTATSAAPAPEDRAAPPASAPMTFRGQFTGTGTFRTDTCTWRTTYRGTITLTLTFGSSSVTGTARHTGSYDDTLIEGPTECGGDANTFDETLPVTGTASALRWRFGHGGTGSVVVTASLIGNAIVGQALVTDTAYAGSATIPFTAN